MIIQHKQDRTSRAKRDAYHSVLIASSGCCTCRVFLHSSASSHPQARHSDTGPWVPGQRSMKPPQQVSTFSYDSLLGMVTGCCTRKQTRVLWCPCDHCLLHTPWRCTSRHMHCVCPLGLSSRCLAATVGWVWTLSSDRTTERTGHSHRRHPTGHRGHAAIGEAVAYPECPVCFLPPAEMWWVNTAPIDIAGCPSTSLAGLHPLSQRPLCALCRGTHFPTTQGSVCESLQLGTHHQHDVLQVQWEPRLGPPDTHPIPLHGQHPGTDQPSTVMLVLPDDFGTVRGPQ